MNPSIARSLLYYPTTFLRREPVRRYLRMYRASQFWSPEQIEAAQRESLKVLWNHAVSKSAFWRERLTPDGLSEDGRFTSLVDFPCLTKADLVLHSERIATRQWFFDDTKITGGSTGQPVKIRKSSDSLARERAATWRAYEWAGIAVADPQARIWGRPISPSARLRYRLVDFVSNRIRLSAFDLSDDKLEAFHRRLVRFKPAYVYGYVSAIRELVEFLHRRELRLPGSVKCIVTTSELLTKEVRDELGSRTGLRVFNEYGCGEVGSIAHECEQGELHIMSENLLLEIDSPTPGEPGEIVVTDLHNHVTPMLRYRLGDFATLSSRKCRCQRGLPVLDEVYGRAYDLLIMPDGRKVHPELPIYVFEEARATLGGISQFQVIQQTPSRLLLRVVKSEDADPAVIREFLLRRFPEVLPGPIDIELEYVPRIERERSGKMRVVRRQFD